MMDASPAEIKRSPRTENPNQLLYSLMIPGIILPLAGWMFSVSVPIIRTEFQIEADTAAWIVTAFSLPFMLIMPVYGRLSDGLGKRRLLLMGITVYSIGTYLAFRSASLQTLIIARLIQGVGIGGTLPLSLALITEVFSPDERGKAMGMFSTVGPLTGVIGPILAGYIVARWGWRMAFTPPLFVGILSVVAVYFLIPGSGKKIDTNFIKRFDWGGVLLLALTLTGLLFYLSSRPITGVDSLQDWRLFLATILFASLFVWYENRQENPFIRIGILANRSLSFGSICALLRMILLSGGFGFLMPQYLVSVYGLTAEQSGYYLMLNPAAMTLFVRLGGAWADRFGSQRITMAGFSIVAFSLLWITRLPFGDVADFQRWTIIVPIILFGVGAGLMLAALHRAALNDVSEAEMGSASGIYSMIRFLGSALGAAIGGILLQYFEGRFPTNPALAFQNVYTWFVVFAVVGLAVSWLLPSVANQLEPAKPT